MRGQLRDDGHARLARHVELGVIGAEVAGDGLGVRRLVVARLVEADGEGRTGRGLMRLHQRDDGRGIDAAGEERAERHVGDHLRLHGVAQQRFECVDGLLSACP